MDTLNISDDLKATVEKLKKVDSIGDYGDQIAVVINDNPALYSDMLDRIKKFLDLHDRKEVLLADEKLKKAKLKSALYKEFTTLFA